MKTSHLAILSSATLSAVACASVPSPGAAFLGESGQVATISGAPGERLLSIVAAGNSALGAGVQADCELRAKEDGPSSVWRILPFQSDTMQVTQQDVSQVQFALSPRADGTFSIRTDFGEKNCAVGLSFSGQYRHR